MFGKIARWEIYIPERGNTRFLIAGDIFTANSGGDIIESKSQS